MCAFFLVEAQLLLSGNLRGRADLLCTPCTGAAYIGA